MKKGEKEERKEEERKREGIKRRNKKKGNGRLKKRRGDKEIQSLLSFLSLLLHDLNTFCHRYDISILSINFSPSQHILNHAHFFFLTYPAFSCYSYYNWPPRPKPHYKHSLHNFTTTSPHFPYITTTTATSSLNAPFEHHFHFHRNLSINSLT